jgi:hypothetical protein
MPEPVLELKSDQQPDWLQAFKVAVCSCSVRMKRLNVKGTTSEARCDSGWSLGTTFPA